MLPVKLWDVVATLESIKYRVTPCEDCEDTFSVRGKLLDIVDTLRLTHPLKMVDHGYSYQGERAIVVFSTGHAVGLRAYSDSSELVYVKAWSTLWEKWDELRDCRGW